MVSLMSVPPLRRPPPGPPPGHRSHTVNHFVGILAPIVRLSRSCRVFFRSRCAAILSLLVAKVARARESAGRLIAAAIRRVS